MKSKPITDCVFACAGDSTCVHPKAMTPECHIDACPRLAVFMANLLTDLARAEQTIRNLARCGALSGDYVEIAENEAANLRRDIAKAKGEQ